jgi:osmoprotectant transport system permease protein
MTWHRILEHLFIVVAASCLSLLAGLPLGIAAYRFPRARKVILKVADILQTIPSLALLGIIMVVLRPGKTVVVIGIALYSLLPIVSNTCVGLEEVDPGVKEAARGMGMSPMHQLLMLEFPLAFPTVLTGIRIAVVNAIGTAVFAAFVGGGGLGGAITQAIRVKDMGMILSATGVLMVMAVGLDLLMGRVEHQARKKRGGGRSIWMLAAALVLALVVLWPFSRSTGTGLMLYDGDYSETQILTHMAKYLLEDQTDLEVTIQDQMSQVNNFKALIGPNHTCDMMPSYDGTLLTTFFHEDTADIPDGMSLYDYVNEQAEARCDARLLAKLGFNNTYAIAVPEAVAERYGLEKVSDLEPVAPELVFGAEQEFFTLEGSMKYDPFVAFYGLRFRNAVSLDIGLKYAAVENGSVDVTVVYATDGMNRKVGLKILEDDRNFFPEYNGAYLVREDTFTRFADEAPDLEEVMNRLAGLLPSETMADLTYQVDVLGRGVDEVAVEFLRENGLIG